MKKIGLVITAAILGGIITFSALKLTGSNQARIVKIEHLPNTASTVPTHYGPAAGEAFPPDFTGVSKKVMPAVVHIKSTRLQKFRDHQYRNYPDPFRDFFDDDLFRHFFGPGFRNQSPGQIPQEPRARIGTGSGVIINSDGYIVTNNHVIDNSDEIEVTLDDNRVFKAKIIGTDPSTDLALLQIKEKNLPSIPFADSDGVEVGEWVLAVGNPFNLNSTVTAGIVSAKGRNINILQDRSAIESFIQTDAAINPGNSGGALVNLRGGLIGINTAIASPTGAYAGYGFAIPSNIVSKVVEDLLQYGIVQRGYLGLIIRDVTGELVSEKNLKISNGVYVDSLATNSAAGDAGVKEGDVIIEVDGNMVRNTAKLLEIIGRHHPGDKVVLKIDRSGKKMDFPVTLRNQQGEEKMIKSDSEDILGVLGVELEEIDKQTAKFLGIDNGLRITKLYPGILQQHTEIREGFIITKVDGNEIKSVDQFKKYLEKKTGGVMLEGVYEDYPGTYYYAFGL
ncbi:MAG: Do family serine endopeptidase [Prolixibacteraceae bacterium]|jgi:Do/DeqQ family serine protease|nr:Do family serine endopeptidase [Prolixibacteraceae bacterium]NLO02039.1 Do family serine endopeptidase [Bacteroidales bacterium]